MKKKLVSLLLTVVLCLIPVAAYAIGIDLDPKVPGGEDTGTLVGKVNKVLGVVQVIGFVVAIVMVMYVGIKYLTAGAGQKAEVKSTMVPMLVGAAMVGLAPTLVNWIWGIFTTPSGS